MLAQTRGTQAPPQSRLALVETHRDSSKKGASRVHAKRKETVTGRFQDCWKVRPVLLKTRAAATPAMPPPTTPTTAADFEAIA